MENHHPISNGNASKFLESPPELTNNSKSTFEPDYCAVRLKNDPWIVQPFEHYEEIRIEELKNKHKKKG